MKHLYLKLAAALALAFAVAMPMSADIPVYYYKDAEGKSEAALKNALSALSVYTPKGQIETVYSKLAETFKSTDVRADKNDPSILYWWDMYSAMDVNIDIRFGVYMNREHSFPKSWWGGLTSTPAYCDLNHLYPGEAKANVAKSNWPLGRVAKAEFDNGVVLVGAPYTGCGGGATKVFEPNDEYKGDFARTYFYVLTRYQDLRWNTSYMWMMEQNTYPTLQQWAIDMLLEWNRNDPVSQKEIDRNEKVYQIQNNRNPFIDYPVLAEYLWGNRRGEKFYTSNGGTPSGEPELSVAPSLDFTQVALGESVQASLHINGANLQGSLELMLIGADKAMFSIPVNEIKGSAIEATGGYTLPITYKPSALGTHQAQLYIAEGGLTGSYLVKLIGECLPKPDLKAVVALEPTAIGKNSYTANWEMPKEVVDYFVIQRTRYATDGTSSWEEIVTDDAESNFYVVEDYDPSVSESYNVRSVRLNFRSPVSNEVYVNRAGVGSITDDVPFGWAPYPGGVRIVSGATLHDVAVYDIAGRLIRVLDTVANDDIIELPLGAYIISDGRTTLRVLIAQ